MPALARADKKEAFISQSDIKWDANFDLKRQFKN